MKLYTYWRSSAAYRVRIALNLKNITCEYEYVNLVKDGGEHKKSSYTSKNPQGLGIAIHEKQITHGHSLHTSFLYSSEEGRPNFLTGLQMGILTVGSQEIQCVRTVWDFLGTDIDLRKVLKDCGVIDANKVKVPDYVIDGTDNQLAPGDIYLTPNY